MKKNIYTKLISIATLAIFSNSAFAQSAEQIDKFNELLSITTNNNSSKAMPSGGKDLDAPLPRNFDKLSPAQQQAIMRHRSSYARVKEVQNMDNTQQLINVLNNTREPYQARTAAVKMIAKKIYVDREAGEREIEILIDTLQNSNEHDFVRAAAGYTLALGQESSIIDTLIANSRSSSSHLRQWSIVSLTQFEGGVADRALPAVIERLKSDNNAKIRRRAAEALGTIGSNNSATRDALLHALDDKDNFVRRWAMDSVTKLGIQDPRINEKIASDLKNNTGSSSAAARALGKLGSNDESSVNLLLERSKAQNRRVRESSIKSLGKLGIKNDKIYQRLVEVIKNDSNESVKRSAIMALGELKYTEAENMLISMLESGKYDNFTEISLVAALGSMGTEKSRNAVLKYYNN